MLVIDLETTIFNEGAPFDSRNWIVMSGCKSPLTSLIKTATKTDYAEMVSSVQEQITKATLLVGFNLKFDLHWLMQYGVKFQDKQVWDCQIAHFIITHQLEKFPSLNGVAEYYGLGQKLDVIKTEYWEKGISTEDVPVELLTEYLQQDLDLTEQVYNKQQEYLADKPKLKRLIQLACLDLLVLQEMEFNGIKYNHEEGLKLAADMTSKVEGLEKSLEIMLDITTKVNWASDDQLRAILYGGTISRVEKEEYEFVYKDGRKKIKLRNVTKETKFPRIVAPIDKAKTEGGKYQVGGPIISQLKFPAAVKKVKTFLMEMAVLQKEISTLLGLTKLAKEQCWENNTLHGQFNQVVAVTGRLSSSKPNQQNLSDKVDPFIYSRF